MTPSEYIAAGYPLSAHQDQAFITLAENDVEKAYIAPIVGNATLSTSSQAVVKATKMRLAFMLMSERSAKDTRSGAKLKLNANSQPLGAAAVIDEMATSAHLAIEDVRALPDVDNPAAQVMDVCKIYFESNFIHS